MRIKMIDTDLTNVFMQKVFRFVNVTGQCTNKNSCLIWLIISVQYMEESFLREMVNSASSVFIASSHETVTY